MELNHLLQSLFHISTHFFSLFFFSILSAKNIKMIRAGESICGNECKDGQMELDVQNEIQEPEDVNQESDDKIAETEE